MYLVLPPARRSPTFRSEKLRNKYLRSNRYNADSDDKFGGSSRLSSLSRRLAKQPKDAISLCLATAAVGIIVVNALFLQSGPHPAPIFADVTIRPVTTGAIAAPRPAKASLSANDPIAELIESPARVVAVQRALSAFGYGQIRPTGKLGPETIAAIQQFERDHNLPITGQMSERLTRQLTAMKGSPL